MRCFYEIPKAFGILKICHIAKPRNINNTADVAGFNNCSNFFIYQL